MPSVVKFSQPPVIEVVCGVLFSSLEKLKSAHVGVFWQSLSQEFPRIEEVAPINPVVEAAQFTTPEIQMEMSDIPPMRRTWLLNRAGDNLIQIQQDRFLFNWKHVDGSTLYPSYDAVIAKFDQHLAAFKVFINKNELGKISYRQFELTYVNVISSANGLKNLKRSSALVDHTMDVSKPRFLPEPETFNWNTSYALPEGTGRLHISAKSASLRQTREPALHLELTARGISRDPSENQRKGWFDTGHEWITKGFADCTNNELHNAWGRIS